MYKSTHHSKGNTCAKFEVDRFHAFYSTCKFTLQNYTFRIQFELTM